MHSAHFYSPMYTHKQKRNFPNQQTSPSLPPSVPQSLPPSKPSPLPLAIPIFPLGHILEVSSLMPPYTPYSPYPPLLPFFLFSFLSS